MNLLAMFNRVLPSCLRELGFALYVGRSDIALRIRIPRRAQGLGVRFVRLFFGLSAPLMLVHALKHYATTGDGIRKSAPIRH